ncbi:hypothetical protein A3K63_01030 [Candidatus Micrarchaeota archaeon RBG_16_49_10]|nr:MAG: hypothetical protein A3K63_01030 [Candidatus Micrarchaeota archaeon RBG_16_49_10]
MFCYKLHEIQGHVILGVCDKDILGKTIRADPEFVVNGSFYFHKEAEEKALEAIFKECTMANLVGKKIVDFALKRKLITKENIIMIGEVPHAQLVR